MADTSQKHTTDLTAGEIAEEIKQFAHMTGFQPERMLDLYHSDGPSYLCIDLPMVNQWMEGKGPVSRESQDFVRVLRDELPHLKKKSQLERHTAAAAIQLGDLLTTKQIRQLYSNPQNGFGSLALDHEARNLIDAWSRVVHAESGFIQRYATPKMQQALNNTNHIPATRVLPLLEELFDRHASGKASQLEQALLGMGLAPEKIARLPHTADGQLDDTLATGKRSGVSVLMGEVYRPQIHEMFLRKGTVQPSMGRR